MFKKEEFGIELDEKLSIKLRTHTGKKDRFEVVKILRRKEIRTTESTIRSVLFRQSALVETNYKAIEELMNIAVKNITEGHDPLNEAQRFFEENYPSLREITKKRKACQ